MSFPQAPRAPTPSEWPMVKAALNRVFRGQGGRDLAEELPLFLHAGNLHNLRVIVDPSAADSPGAPVSDSILAHAGYLPRLAMIHGRTVRVACVGGVFVLPRHRGRGLAARVVGAVLEAARAESELVLVSGEGGLYQRQGLRQSPPLLRFHLPRGAPSYAKIRTRDVVQGDIDSVMGMYGESSVHFIRSSGDWQKLIQAGVLVDSPARFSIILRAERPVAYVVAQRAAPGPVAGARAHPRRILECAGEAQAVVDAAPELAEELLIPGYDTRTATCGERAGWLRTTRQLATSAQWVGVDANDADDRATVPWYGLNYL